ncbi:MAG TPA: signal recognition particle-docking protein FtsY [Burkholderiales bacterium]|jgi:fused signal recognition particle receptor|nr:signal recognition particle-docking protein FtsY [Burkholderiales bacterium]
MFSFQKRDKQERATDWTSRLREGLAATRARLSRQLSTLLAGGRRIDEALFEELESVLVSCDVGVDATAYLLARTREIVKRDRTDDAVRVREALKSVLLELLAPLQQPLDVAASHPFVILMAGVNGSGKTTSIGKLARRFGAQGLSVLLAAGDTFRAAAREQLEAWGDRSGVSVVAQTNGDTAAVIFDAVQSAVARNIDVVIADTAGRLPTQPHLMEELKKVKRVIGKALPGAPHEVLLVLDANNGQNAVAQVKAFDAALGVTGLIVTKLDGTAKGGAIAAIARHKPIPLRFVGVGEGIDDLQPFDVRAFVDALFE